MQPVGVHHSLYAICTQSFWAVFGHISPVSKDRGFFSRIDIMRLDCPMGFVMSRAHPTLATYGYIITTTGQREHSSRLADCCRHCPVRITHGVALRAFISVGESGSPRLRVC